MIYDADGAAAKSARKLWRLPRVPLADRALLIVIAGATCANLAVTLLRPAERNYFQRLSGLGADVSYNTSLLVQLNERLENIEKNQTALLNMTGDIGNQGIQIGGKIDSISNTLDRMKFGTCVNGRAC